MEKIFGTCKERGNRLTKGTMAEVTAELEWTRMVMRKPATRRRSSVAKGGTWGMS